jgi:Fe-S cluster assembly protein SufD
MIKKNEQTTAFINNFDKLAQERLNAQAPEWLKKVRSASLTRFTNLGVPTIKNEEWKYTNIAPIVAGKFKISANPALKETNELKKYLSADEIALVFINGAFSAEHSQLKKLPKGVTISTLQEALRQNSAQIEKLIKKYEPSEACTFVSLNNAFSDNGAFVKIEKGCAINELLHIVHVTSSSNGEMLSLPRTLVLLESSAEATILESHVSFSDTISYFANALTDIFLDENASLHYCKAQKESEKAFHIGNTRVWQERNSNLNGFSFMSGAALTRNNLNIVLNGEGTNANLNGLYSIYGSMHTDNHTSVDHRFPNGTSNQLYKGILNESSRAVFNGKIFVKPIAQKTNSYQLNKNLLLGDGCRVDTKPQLEIFADDVKCTHGATIGQLNEDELFYLRSRCISKREATRMLSQGFVDDLINTITNTEINRKLHILLEPSFARF